jgi:methionine sulfoxide reductase heme-binding subunit
MTPLWVDRGGRFSPLKAVTLVCAFLPACVLAGQWAADDLGPRPFTEVTHGTGLWMVRFLMLSLAVSPARAIFSWPRLMLIRRMLGLTALAYGIAHLGLYIFDQNGNVIHVASEIVRRFYLTIGFVALMGLVALGVTSTDAMIRRLGRKWKTLHRLVYPIAVLGLLHYFLQAKLNVWEPTLVAGLFVWLMAWRAVPAQRQRNVVVLAGLGVFACVATAGLEVAWYGLTTSIDPMRVFMSNFTIARGLRPAHWVGIVGIAIVVAAVLRQQVFQPQARVRSA